MPKTSLLLYPINISTPCLRGSRYETCSPMSLFDCLVNKYFLCYKPQHPRVGLALHRANESGTKPSVQGYLCDHIKVNGEWILPQEYKGISFTQNSCLKNIIFSTTSLEIKVTNYPGWPRTERFPRMQDFQG